MKISIGLPGMIPGVKSEQILEWARRADNGPFASLGCLDRLVYPNYEALITLAAAAAVTRRIRLTTTVLLAALHNPAMLAKQTASLDALSGGRLTLGIGVGAREDDFRAAGVDFHTRGRSVDATLALMKRVWSGERLSDDIGAIGPSPARPGGPELLIGGYSDASLRRVARWGDGYITGGGRSPANIQEIYQKLMVEWQAQGKPGKPRLVTSFYCAVEPGNTGQAAAHIRDYYSFMGPRVENMVNALPLTPEAIQERIGAYAALDEVDEIFLWPCIPDPDQVDLLAKIVS